MPTLILVDTAPTERPVLPRRYGLACWTALGSYVRMVVADAGRLACARAEAERVLDLIDRTCSRFRPDSDLVRANQGAGSWIRVHPVLVGVVEAALWAAEHTGGLVVPTLGRTLVELGYDRDLATLPAAPGGDLGPDNPADLPLRGPADEDAWRSVRTDPEGALWIPAGVALDLGATGKAVAADLLAARVGRYAGTGLVVSLGGDLAIAADPDGGTHPWRVAVTERPVGLGDESADELVVLERGGMATSSTLGRRWRHGPRTMHHLLDPRTGRPVDAVWRTASVVGSSCLEANTASTAAVVLGAAAERWLTERDLASRLVSRSGEVVRLAGWPGDA